MVESTDTSQTMRPAASPRACNPVRILCQVPLRCQQRNRPYTLSHGPAHQHLPGAMGPQEVQAAQTVQASQGVVGPGRATRPEPVRALAPDHRIPYDWMVGAV